MTDPIIGRKGRVQLGSAVIANIANFKLDFNTEDQDASVFGSGWGATLPGQQKWFGQVDGFLDMTDVTGQAVMWSAKKNGTKVTNLFFYNSGGGSYWASDITTDSGAGAYVGTMGIDQPNNGLVKVSYKLGGVGPIDLF